MFIEKGGSTKTTYKEIQNTSYNAISHGSHPNIYCIILDAYARDDVLKEIYNYNNSEFTKFLTRKGFYVGKNTYSNYNQTILTLSSMFNFNYINNEIKTKGTNARDRTPLRESIKKSRLFHFLKKHGYQIIALSSKNPDTEISNADIYIEFSGTINHFHNTIINSTPLPVIINFFSKTGKLKDSLDLHREHVLFTFDQSSDLTKYPSPHFLFSHVTAPHPPFVFGKHGEKVIYENNYHDLDGNWLIREGNFSLETYHKAYIEQLIFINKKTKKLIEKILATSKREPVIILMGDHGPRSMLVWENGKNTYMKECMAILYSIYLPGNNYEGFYDGISPVNTFRIILNRFFDTHFSTLEDDSYFSPAFYIYDAIKVSERLHNPDDTIMYRKFGDAFYRKGELNKALEYYKKALEIDPENFLVHYKAGTIFYQKGNLDQAKYHLRKTLHINPDFQPARKELTHISNLQKR
ncbi:tetratricopeptide repeat protein [Thermodesulfobacteriota bacterium]